MKRLRTVMVSHCGWKDDLQILNSFLNFSFFHSFYFSFLKYILHTACTCTWTACSFDDKNFSLFFTLDSSGRLNAQKLMECNVDISLIPTISNV